MKRNWESKFSRQMEGGILINHYANAEGFVRSNRNTEKEEMNKTKFRCLSLAMVVVGILVIGSGVAVAGQQTGIGLGISCQPGLPIDQGTAYSCSFLVTNQSDTAFTITTLTVQGNPVQCISPVTNLPTTTLAAAGQVGDNCSGPAGSGVAPFTCSPTGANLMIGPVFVQGTDAGNNGASQTSSNGPFVNGITCNDENACTIDTCVPTSDPSEVEGCVYTPDPACQGEFCRTAGFWSTHTDSTDTKTCAQNITQAVLDAGGPLNICGELLCNTEADDESSTTEAMCVAVQGQQERQLARQLTAAALNCIVTNGSASCDGVSINEAFDACNAICAGNVDANPDNNLPLGDCIAAIDCFNNGGQWDSVNDFCATGTCGNVQIDGVEPPAGCTQDDLSNCAVGEECIPFPNNCHDAEFGDFETVTLPNDLLAETNECFERQGPADSADCKAAKKSDCLIFGEHESDCEDHTVCAVED
jgi:hypothetical protein